MKGYGLALTILAFRFLAHRYLEPRYSELSYQPSKSVKPGDNQKVNQVSRPGEYCS